MRHGQSENVVAGAAGAMPSAALTALGRKQARTAARLLTGEGVTRVYSSTAVRARDTAAVLAATLGVEAVAMAELVEVGIGIKEGHTDGATGAETAAVLRAWVVDQDLDARVADGETGAEVIGRVTCALNSIAADHRGQTVAVVGHVASLTATLSVVCGLGHRVWGTPLPHALPFRVETDGQSWHCLDWPNVTC